MVVLLPELVYLVVCLLTPIVLATCLRACDEVRGRPSLREGYEDEKEKKEGDAAAADDDDDDELPGVEGTEGPWPAAGLEEGLKMKIPGLGKKGSKLDPNKELKKLFRPLEKIVDKMGAKMNQLDDKLEAIPKAMLKEIRSAERKTASGLNLAVKKITRVVDKVVTKLERFVEFVVEIALAIGSYLRCGVEKIVQLPACWYFYALEMFGKLLYAPIAFLFWVSGQRAVERALWTQLETLDAAVYASTRGIWGDSSSSARRSGRGASGASTAATSVPSALALALFRAVGLRWDYGCPENPYVADARYRPDDAAAAASAAGATAASWKRKSSELEEGLHLIHLPDWVVDKCYLCGGGGGGSGGRKQGLRSFPNPKDYF